MFLRDANSVVNTIVGGWSLNFIFGSGHLCRRPHAESVVKSSGIRPATLATQIGQTDYSPLGGSPMQARGTHFNNIDFSIFKEISLEKHGRLEFRAEAFNLTNTPQFGQPGNLDFLSSPNFSQINSLRNNPRLWQFALKYYF
jgi:hypothetical protein